MAVYGTINNYNFVANKDVQLGLLPENARPTFAHQTQTKDSRLFITITAGGQILITSWQNANNVQSYLSFSRVVAKK